MSAALIAKKKLKNEKRHERRNRKRKQKNSHNHIIEYEIDELDNISLDDTYFAELKQRIALPKIINTDLDEKDWILLER